MLNTSLCDNEVTSDNASLSNTESKTNNKTTDNTVIVNDKIAKSAFDALPQNIQAPLLNAKRVILIANNPSISIKTLQAMLQPSDVVVLFNHFVYADFFATDAVAKQLPKLFFLRQIGSSAVHFGLPPRQNNVNQLTQMLEDNPDTPVTFLFSNIDYGFPTPEDNPSPHDDPISDDPNSALEVSKLLKQHIKEGDNRSVIDENHAVVADYPRFEEIHSSAPSSGFFIYRLMLAVRRYLAQEFDHDLQIVMLGFNHDKKTDFFWHGHNWQFERASLNPPPEGVCLVRQV